MIKRKTFLLLISRFVTHFFKYGNKVYTEVSVAYTEVVAFYPTEYKPYDLVLEIQRYLLFLLERIRFLCCLRVLEWRFLIAPATCDEYIITELFIRSNPKLL